MAAKPQNLSIIFQIMGDNTSLSDFDMDSSREGSISSRGGGDDGSRVKRPKRKRGFRISPRNEEKISAALSEYG